MDRGEVEDTRLDAKSTKKIQGQGQLLRGQTLSRPSTGMLEAKDTRALKKNNNNNEVFKNVSQVISKKQGLQKFFSGNLQNFKDLKNSAVLEPRTKQFSRTWDFKAKDFKMCPRGLHLCKRNVTVELKNS